MMSVNGLANARLAVASLVNGVSFFRRPRPDRDDPPSAGWSRIVRKLLALRRARRAVAATSRNEAITRAKAQRERFELLLAQVAALEETSRRSAWLRQSRLAMQQLDDMLSGRGPLPGGKPAAGAGHEKPAAGPAGGDDE